MLEEDKNELIALIAAKRRNNWNAHFARRGMALEEDKNELIERDYILRFVRYWATWWIYGTVKLYCILRYGW